MVTFHLKKVHSILENATVSIDLFPIHVQTATRLKVGNTRVLNMTTNEVGVFPLRALVS